MAFIVLQSSFKRNGYIGCFALAAFLYLSSMLLYLYVLCFYDLASVESRVKVLPVILIKAPPPPPPVDAPALHHKAVFHSLFLLFLCVLGPCFVLHYIVSFLVL